ncbi:MAG: HDOD domain-containing protein [Methylomonas sp.]|jgi:HD-like signal output (HDOD) protein
MAFGFLRRLFGVSRHKAKIPAPANASFAEKPVADRQLSTGGAQLDSALQNDNNYQSLATSFNDYLLGANLDMRQEPNEIENFIITNLEAMLRGEIPDSAVPRLPDVGMALLKELTNINISSETIMSYIIRDPALASEVLNMANSVLFRSNTQEKITNLTKAVTILGLNNLKTIVSSVLMKRMVLIAPIYFRMFGQHLWRHSQDCGQACRALAKFYGQCDPNNAYLVGLMHDIGKLAIFGLLTKALGQHINYQPRGSVFSTIVRDHSQELSAKIARKWELPDYLLTALSEQSGELSHASRYGFILNQANILAEFKAIAEKEVKAGGNFDDLLVKYSIPLHLFIEAFPDDYRMLAETGEN